MKNYIVKIEDGKPVIYGDVGDENDGTAPTYIFETEESYDAALADGLIPVGALIVKTYDAVEMAGGPFDAALSEESENAVQNKIIAAQVARLDEAIADAVALRASLTGFGMGKITPVDVTDITEAYGRVLGGFEKNPAFAGSLANKIENKSIKTSCLVRARKDAAGINDFEVTSIEKSFYNYGILLFVLRYLQYAVLASALIPSSEFRAGVEVHLNNTNTPSAKVGFESETSMRFSLTEENTVIEIYGIN